MDYQQDLFRHQYDLVDRFVRHLTYYRTLYKGYTECGLQNEFWHFTTEAHLCAATTHWCMVFGSEGCNPTHWKRLSEKQSKELVQSFRDGLLQELQLDEAGWKSYWNSVKRFRDKWVAHRELLFPWPTPNFDTALNVAYYYDKWVRTIISPDTLVEPSLEQFATSQKQAVTPLIDRLLRVTQEPI